MYISLNMILHTSTSKKEKEREILIKIVKEQSEKE